VIVMVLMGTVLCLSAWADDASEETHYGLFFTRAKHITQLLQAGDVKNANRVWNKEADYFKQSTKSADKACSQNLADAVEKSFAHVVMQTEADIDSTEWPTSPKNWPSVKGVIAKADALVQDVDSYQVLGYLGRRDAVVQGIKAAKERLQAKMSGDAIDCFLSYRPSADRDFFFDYPLHIEPKE
jgi:hypothetical protein